MARQVQLVTIQAYMENWYNKSPAVQVNKAYWSADLEIIEVEKIEGKQQYRIQLSDQQYRSLDAHIEIFLELY